MKSHPLILALLVILLGACAHDIIEKDAVISPDGVAGVDTAPTEDVNGKAGNASEGSTELNIVYFGFDSYTLRPDAVETLKKNLDFLRQESEAAIQIEGHCDERGTSEYNLALGERRANAVRAYLIKQGIAKNRISVISFGKERPAEMGHHERAWAKNRRAVSSILE